MKRREMNGCYEQQSEKKKYNNSIEVILFISILGKKPCKKIHFYLLSLPQNSWSLKLLILV